MRCVQAVLSWLFLFALLGSGAQGAQQEQVVPPRGEPARSPDSDLRKAIWLQLPPGGTILLLNEEAENGRTIERLIRRIKFARPKTRKPTEDKKEPRRDPSAR